MLYSIFMN